MTLAYQGTMTKAETLAQLAEHRRLDELDCLLCSDTCL